MSPEQNALPAHYQLTYSSASIAQACKRLGAEVSRWATEVAQLPGGSKAGDVTLLTIPILRGGLFFYADLVRAIASSVELVTATASSYDISTNTQNVNAEIKTYIDAFSVAGRHILLVDDICDSGKTLANLKADFLARGAAAVRTAVLIRRLVPGSPHTPDYVGFVYPGPEWFVGYGMDDEGKYRNLGAVYTMSKS